MKRTLLNTASVLSMLIIVYALFNYESSRNELNWTGPEFPIAQYVALAILLLLGIGFGSLFRQIKSSSGSISIVKEISQIWSSRSLWCSILVSPIVFGAVFVLSSDIPTGAAALFLAFQNGFFCDSVFSGLVPETTTNQEA